MPAPVVLILAAGRGERFLASGGNTHKLREKIYKELKVDIHLIQWDDLRYNSYLALLFTRMFYLLKDDPIPKTIEERAAY